MYPRGVFSYFEKHDSFDNGMRFDLELGLQLGLGLGLDLPLFCFHSKWINLCR